MRAFVLSGGGNLGPLQVGALRALLEHGIEPDMLVGCSAGALNAAFLARDVSLAQVDVLADIWRTVRKQDVYPGGRIQAFWRFLAGKESLYDNRRFYAFLQRWGTTPATTFDQFDRVRLFVTATRLSNGTLHVFGDNGGDRVLDALMASTALTPMHPPWEIDGVRYIDGGTVTPLPLRVALDRGATEIYALHIVGRHEMDSDAEMRPGVVGALRKSVSTMLHLSAQQDLQLAERNRVRLHQIHLCALNSPVPDDFSQEEVLFETGYEQAMTVLRAQRQESPRQVGGRTSWWRRIRRSLSHPGVDKESDALPTLSGGDHPRLAN